MNNNDYMNWFEYFIAIAETVKLKSKDKSTQIGAIIVGRDNEIISTGYNSFPRNINDDVAIRNHRPEKYYWMSHAETNAIVNAALIGVSTRDSTMYTTSGIPCADCARNIINAGIRRLYYKKECTTKDDRWKEHAYRSAQMLLEANVNIIEY